jgi:hypothetical protein
MEAFFAPHIRAHRLVTVHAQAVLRPAIELHVALIAIILVLGMPLHQFAWRHDGLNALCLHRRCQCQRQAQSTREPQEL